MTHSLRAFAALLLAGSAALSPAVAATGTMPAGTAGAAPGAVAILARIRVAQATGPATGASTGQPAAPAGDSQAAAARSDAVRRASPTPVASRQPTGAFPTNEISRQPWIDLGAGEDALRKDIGALQQTLTELQQLQLQTKQAHWNVSGTLYYPLHLLLQEHYEGLSKYADTIAERLLAVGASADGRANTIVRTSGVPEIPGGFLDDAQVLAWFTQAYKRVGEEVNRGIKVTEDIDPTTSNLLQEVEHGIAKYQWQMRAHLQRTGTDPNAGRDLNDGKPVELPGQPGTEPGQTAPDQSNPGQTAPRGTPGQAAPRP
ncbi:ferritin-like domain-containing protein [uncultured Methylobacterium sp.]|uniref:ferritin-like domain-containing protein n=1 Tax=uncultured Methylobacterium sp. TaxID=157278 RepID=UPI0025974C2C|nr:ferritin-like domain-containing protein [uncultured Methylobacterium sp.]